MNYSKDNNNKKLKNKNAYSKKATNKIWIFIKSTFIILFLVGIFGLIGVGAGAYFGILKNAPAIDEIEITGDVFPTVIYSEVTGEELATLDAEQTREYVTLDKVPLHLQKAFIAVEDERFYDHTGIDLKGMVRSVYVLFTSDNMQGASTITQQLIKNSRGLNYNDFISKLQEQYMAVNYEKQLTEELGTKKAAKDQILEYYLNIINLGNRIHGVQAAAEYYFSKNVSELTISESAVIAAVTNWPSRYNPTKDPEANKTRRDRILDKMLEQEYITQDEYDTAMAEDVYTKISEVQAVTQEVNSINSYFVDQVQTEVMRDLQEKLGYSEEEASNLLFNRGLQIYATQDPAIQSIVDEVYLDDSYFPNADYKIEVTFNISIKNTVSGETNHYSRVETVNTEEEIEPFLESVRSELVGQSDEIVGEKYYPVVQPQSSFTIMENGTGKVLAITGGRGEKLANRGLNRATGSLIQPGSTFKILAAYAPGIDLNSNGMTAGKIYIDEPFTVGGYSPNNWWGSSYRGASTVREGITQSMNVVTVKALDDVGIENSYNYLLNFGFTSLVDNDVRDGKVYTDKTYSSALGGLTDGISNLELTAAYHTIANGGVYVKPTFYTKVLNHQGETILDNTSIDTRRVLKETSAYILTDMMKDVITKGTGTAAKFNYANMPIAGKTGTTTETKDLTFAGYTPYLTAVIWSGNDQPSQIKGGTTYPKTIWSTIMSKAHEAKGYAYKDFTVPDGLTYVAINKNTGLLPAYEGQEGVYTEIFEKGTEPTEKSTMDTTTLLDEESGLYYYIDSETGEKMVLVLDPVTGEYVTILASEYLNNDEMEDPLYSDEPIIITGTSEPAPSELPPGISIGIPGASKPPEPSKAPVVVEPSENPYVEQSHEPIVVPEYTDEIDGPIIDDSQY